MRFYEVTGGSAKVDGTEFSEMNVNNLRKQIGYVGQMPILFNTTVRENILLGKPDASEAEVIAAAKAAHAHTFIMDLSDGYDTKLGPSGGLLSGGQKQRIAIARGIISNPQILVLDEATGTSFRVLYGVLLMETDNLSLFLFILEKQLRWTMKVRSLYKQLWMSSRLTILVQL